MREIKFRAWFTRDEKYIKPMTIQNMIHQKVSTFSLSVLYNEVVFEQYTGLKDFNGAEIYEGDILQDVDDSTIVGIVEYNEAFGEYDCGDNNLYECTRDCVVIGNIHEFLHGGDK
ncbi:YopX family protein [Leuconostoc carnosum]|uniref:YopX family protein n=1 Tax=Leuconostoc carnosum TaxID=1252 RepID=UPI003889C54E